MVAAGEIVACLTRDRVFEIFVSLRVSWPLAALASGPATGACSVSSNVAALLSKTVISPANQERCLISGHLALNLSRALGREKEEKEGQIDECLFARERSA
jgi:hypothetical protein